MKKITYETHYHEDLGATLKHKCGKRIVALSLLSFSLIFLFGPFSSLFLWPLFFCPGSHPDLWGNHSLHHPFLTWDNALIMMIITLLFFLQLNNYNSISRTKDDSIWMPPAVYRDGAMNQEWHVWKNYEWWLWHNTMSTTWSCKAIWQWWTCHDKRNGGNCMAIYLGMAMEMP